MTPEQEKKLPAYARDELAKLRVTIRELERADPSRAAGDASGRGVYLRSYVRHETRDTLLGGVYTRIVFKTQDGEFEASYSTTSGKREPGLVVSTFNGVLAIVPEASNLVRVESIA